MKADNRHILLILLKPAAAQALERQGIHVIHYAFGLSIPFRLNGELVP